MSLLTEGPEYTPHHLSNKTTYASSTSTSTSTGTDTDTGTSTMTEEPMPNTPLTDEEDELYELAGSTSAPSEPLSSAMSTMSSDMSCMSTSLSMASSQSTT